MRLTKSKLSVLAASCMLAMGTAQASEPEGIRITISVSVPSEDAPTPAAVEIAHEIELPSLTEIVSPEAETPEAPETEEPEAPEAPEVEEPEAPEAPEIEEPEAPEIEEPEIEEPEAPEIEEPEIEEPEEPES